MKSPLAALGYHPVFSGLANWRRHLKRDKRKKQKLRKIIVGNVENKTGTDKKQTMDSNISKIDLGGWKS